MYVLERMEKEKGDYFIKMEEESLSGIKEEDGKIAYHSTLENVEKQMVQDALAMAKGNKTKAGEILGLPRKTLVYRMEKLGIK